MLYLVRLLMLMNLLNQRKIYLWTLLNRKIPFVGHQEGIVAMVISNVQ